MMFPSKPIIWFICRAGWWFGTCCYQSGGNFIIPTEELIFFRGVGWNYHPIFETHLNPEISCCRKLLRRTLFVWFDLNIFEKMKRHQVMSTGNCTNRPDLPDVFQTFDTFQRPFRAYLALMCGKPSTSADRWFLDVSSAQVLAPAS